MQQKSSLTLTYTLALGAIALLNTGIFVIQNKLLSEQRSTPAIVNYAGTRRFLSQRVAIFSRLLVIEPANRNDHRKDLEEAINLLERNHNGLLYGNKDLGLPGTPSEKAKKKYFAPQEPEENPDGGRDYDRRLRTYISEARQLLTAPESELVLDNPHLSYIRKHGPYDISKTTNEMVFLYQTEGRERIDNLLQLQSILYFMTLGGLVAVGIFIFNPMVKKIQQQTEGLIDEIAERKRTETELAKAKEVAEAANAAKSSFLAGMSHELRTPLNAILGFAQLMTRDRNITGKQKDNVQIIARSGEHLLGLINDVLEMSKIEAGQIVLNENSFDLYGLCESIATMMGIRAQAKQLQFLVEIAPDVPRYIYTDEGKLRQILINLIGNAIKFTQEGGIAVRVGIKSTSEHLLFEIEDTGVGIAEAEIDKLFKPFVQTESGTKSHEGTGLGLTISQRFVQLMGGDITVKSVVNQGTVFSFDLKVGLTSAQEVKGDQVTRRVVKLVDHSPQYRILIVDDRLENRMLLREWLVNTGFIVKEATNGAEAVELAEQWEPHLIWMDIRMPIMDGYKATTLIKSTTKGKNIKIIALTASVFENERSLVLAAGCDDFVRKPVRESTIFEKLSEYLGAEFIYDEDLESTPVDKAELQEFRPDMLAALSGEWLEKLRQAVDELDVETAEILVEEIQESHSNLANILSHYLRTYRLDQLQSLLQQPVSGNV